MLDPHLFLAVIAVLLKTPAEPDLCDVVHWYREDGCTAEASIVDSFTTDVVDAKSPGFHGAWLALGGSGVARVGGLCPLGEAKACIQAEKEPVGKNWKKRIGMSGGCLRTIDQSVQHEERERLALIRDRLPSREFIVDFSEKWAETSVGRVFLAVIDFWAKQGKEASYIPDVLLDGGAAEGAREKGVARG